MKTSDYYSGLMKPRMSQRATHYSESICIALDPDLLKALKKKVRDLDTQLSTYVRQLIRKDLGQ